MKKIMLLAVTTVAAIGLSSCDWFGPRNYTDCTTPDGTEACWNAEERSYRWEEDAVVEIGVDNDTMGAALIEQWNADYPDLANKLVYRNYGSVNGASTGMQGIQDGQGEAPDVALVIDNEVTGKEASVLPLHPYFVDLANEQTLESVNTGINKTATYFLSSFYDGMTFSWNKTMLEALDISLTDANNDGLPDAVDTFEEIFALAESYETRPEFTFETNRLDDNEDPISVTKTIKEFYPLSLDEPWSAYSSLTAGGWELFGGADLLEPEFDAPEFLEGLEFIQAFGETNMSVDDTGAKKAASAMGWRWDDYLNGNYPFSLVGTWMDVDGKEATENLDFKFSAMPTYEGQQLSPLMKTKGFVVNAYSLYPSASSEVLRWLYSAETFGTMVNNSSYLPALETDAAIYPEITSENKEEFAFGMRFNHLEPAGSLPLSPTTRAMNVYYAIGITDFYKAVWDGTKTPAVAQTEIVSAATAWIAANNVAA
jgi:arabinogalactan oligomer / maltooligosaccharide transport system substrate-binding protein